MQPEGEICNAAASDGIALGGRAGGQQAMEREWGSQGGRCYCSCRQRSEVPNSVGGATKLQAFMVQVLI